MKGQLTVTWGGATHNIALPVIAGIEDQYSAALTEIPTVIYGAENTFVMDLGTQRRFTLNCTRINPFPYDDSSDHWSDSAKWSNGHWMTRLIETLDHWQNDMEPNGGFLLRLTSDDEELYPDITKNVFLAGSISPKYSVQKMTFSLPLAVASMKGEKTEVDTVKITFDAGVDGVRGRSFTQSYPINTLIPVPAIPSSWQGLKTSSYFSNWVSPYGTPFYPGEMVTWTSEMTMTAVWQGPLEDHHTLTSPGSYEVSVPGEATRAMIYAVGAGGGSGITLTVYDTSGTPSSESISQATMYPGGAGAGGEVMVANVMVRNVSSIDIYVGAGGKSASGSSYDGGDGEDTYVTIGGKQIVAKGGEGGKGARTSNYKTVLGGQSVWPGGNGGLKPTAGKTDSGSPTPGLPGRATGEEEWQGGFPIHSYGGAGGGAGPLYQRFWDGELMYRCCGGDGGSSSSDAESGRWGGGAGSGHGAHNTKGGDGLVAILFFK